MPASADSAAGFSLMQQVASGALTLPSKQRDQRAFFRFLRRAVNDVGIRDSIHRLQERVMLAFVRESRKRPGGIVVAITGMRGGEGSSFLATMLGLSLGSCTQRKVSVLDGKFNTERFSALTDVLGLSRNAVSTTKGNDGVTGLFNPTQPNVAFLRPQGFEQGMQFFSDRDLETFLDDLRKQFDFTILDMPALLEDASNVFVAPLVDELYLVAKAGQSRQADFDRSHDLVKETGSKISGVVINQQKVPFWARIFWGDFFQ